jgi:hypothetical protein
MVSFSLLEWYRSFCGKFRSWAYRKQPFYLLPFLMIDALMWQKNDKKIHPEYYLHHGVFVFTGLYGSGKSLNMVRYLGQLLEQNPSLVMYSNFAYPNSIPLTSLVQIEASHHPKGSVYVIDEAHLSFFCRDYGSFPIEMVSSLAQNRKDGKIFLFATQNFEMVDKQIRLQAFQIIDCRSWFKLFFRSKWYTPMAYEKRFVTFDKRPSALCTTYFVGYPELFEQYSSLKRLTKIEMKV